MTKTKEVATTKKVLEDLSRILEQEKDQEKKQDFVRSIVKIISNDYGSTGNVDLVCTLFFQGVVRRSNLIKAGKDPEIQDITILEADAAPSEDDEAQGTADNAPDDPTNKPWMWCLSLDQLNEIGSDAERDYGSIWFNKANMHQIVEKVAVPYCQKTGKGFWASKNPKGLKITVFVTHSWKENFKEMLQSINSVFRNSLQKPNLWICAFALIQGNFSMIKDQVSGNDLSLRASPFVQALEKADFFLVVRNSFGDLYSRIWCVCELMFALEFGLVPSRTYITGPDVFADSTSGCLEAEASVPEDRDRILTHLTSSMKPEEVDNKIMEFRQLKLPSQSNSRRTLFIIFATFILFTTATTLSIYFTRQTRNTTEDEILKYIDESDFPSLDARSNDESNQRKAVNWLVDQYSTNKIMLENSTDRKKEVVDLFILSSFYFAMNDGFLGVRDNWLKGLNYCDWSGIECKDRNIITELNLSNRNLVGTLSMEIAKMTTLIELNVSNNNLTSVPSEIFGGFSYFRAQKGGLKRIQKGGLKQLESLDISKNILQSVPETIWDLKHLRTLDISSNNIQSVLEGIESAPAALTDLSVQGNGLSDEEINQIMLSTHLEFNGHTNLYEVPKNQTVGAIVTDAVENNKIVTNKDLFEFLASYSTLTITNTTYIKKELIKEAYREYFISKIPATNARILEDGVTCARENGTPQNLALISVVNPMIATIMSGNDDKDSTSYCGAGKIRNGICKEFYACCSDFGYCCGDIPWCSTKDVSRTGTYEESLVNKLVQYCLIVFYHSTKGSGWNDKRNWLGAGNNYCNWNHVKCNGENVVELDLNDNTLEGTIPVELFELRNLTSLLLNNNSLTGLIPTEIGLLTDLTSLNISQNQLTGTIPSEIGLLTDLTSLYISQNQLTGTIPSEIGQLTELKSLHLFHNYLFGSIPEVLCSNNWIHVGPSIDCNQISCNDNCCGDRDDNSCLEPTQNPFELQIVYGRYMKYVEASGDGNLILGIDPANNVYYRYGANDSWALLNGGEMVDISVSQTGAHIWGISPTSGIYYRNGINDTWSEVIGALNRITVNANNTLIYGVDDNEIIYSREGVSGSWKEIQGLLVQVSVSGDGNDLWGANAVSDIFHRTRNNATWDSIDGLKAKWVSTNYNGGFIWAITPDDKIYYRLGKSGSWVLFPGSLKSISVSGPSGEYVWGVDAKNNVYHLASPPYIKKVRYG